jgi:hypothetical protein
MNQIGCQRRSTMDIAGKIVLLIGASAGSYATAG